MEGAKMVLFITGLCSRRCFYCPISEEKWQSDVIYANELFIGECGATVAMGANSANEEEASVAQTATGHIEDTSSAGEHSEPAGLLQKLPSEHADGELLTESELAAIMEEAEAMDALGTGITGGDPMDVPDRVIQVIKALKSRFGPEHHIHMYTSGSFDPRYIEELEQAGLDEIRFHPPPSMWSRLADSRPESTQREGESKDHVPEGTVSPMDRFIQRAADSAMVGPRLAIKGVLTIKGRLGKEHRDPKEDPGDSGSPINDEPVPADLDETPSHKTPETGKRITLRTIDQVIRRAAASSMDAGVEVPALPGHEKQLQALIGYMEQAGLTFLNLNELEISDTNYERLVKQGVADQKTQDSYAVAGSEELALSLVDSYEGRLDLHYCSSAYKDAVQHRQRLIRRARNTAPPYTHLTPDGTLIFGVIEISIIEVEVSQHEAKEAHLDEVQQAAGDAEVRQVLERARSRLLQQHDLAPELCGVDVERRRLEVPADFLEVVADGLSWPCFIVEELPIATRLEVERRPLDGRS